MGTSDCFPPGKPTATESHYPTYGSCRVFTSFHNPPNSDMDYRIFHVRTDVNTCDCTRGCTDTRKRVCTESWLGEKYSLAAPGNRTCVSDVTGCCSNQLSCISHPMFLHNKYYKGQSVKLLRTCKAYLVRCSCSRDLGEAGHSYGFVQWVEGTRAQWSLFQYHTKVIKVIPSHSDMLLSMHSSLWKTKGRSGWVWTKP